MSKSNKIKKHLKQSLIKEALNKRKSISDVDSEKCASISFRHLDSSQGATITDWASNGLFEQTITRFKTICQEPLEKQKGNSFDVYNYFPVKSKYEHPSFVPEDAIWARFHLTGLNVVAGHIYRNVFYVVFLDDRHGFWDMT